jgi:glycerol-3-phosphate dehydrogenase
MTLEEQQRKIQRDHRWGRIVCRCEHVTEAEVLQALHNPLGARCISAVKYRCRAGMGRCQGGFCTQHIVRLMQKEFNLKSKDITLKSKDSLMFKGQTRKVDA